LKDRNIHVDSIQPFSLNDYPSKISAVFFLSGCNWRCAYCHNSELWNSKKEVDYKKFLEEKQGKIEAIVLCGGEPTIYKWLPDLIKEIKSYGYLIKLDTNGSNPDMIEKVLSNINYIAMDIKAPNQLEYEKVAKREVNINDIKRSIQLAKKIEHRFRHTYTSFSFDDLVAMCELVNEGIFLQKKI